MCKKINVNNLKKSFKNYILFGINKNKIKIKNGNEVNETLIKNCIEKAYKDMMPRTIAYLKKVSRWYETNNKGESFKEYITDDLKKAFINYFRNKPFNNNKAFNDWFVQICEDFVENFYNKCNINIIKKYKLKFPLVEIQFGKAQKIVNMTFKYLFLLKDAKRNKKYFKFCHCPVDSIIIKKLNKEYGFNSITTVWSNLSQEEYEKIQNFISEICEKEKISSNLIFDFVHWKK